MTEPRSAITRQFRAMSVWIELTGIDVPDAEVEWAAGELRELAEDWERHFSRFRPRSELSLLNQRAGEWTVVSADMVALLAAAVDGWRATGGRFDPALLPLLEDAGYDRSFEQIADRRGHLRSEVPGARHGAATIELDVQRGRVRLAPGTRLDLGGIAKGAFVDRAAGLVEGWPGACIDAGGDLRVWGQPPSGERWAIGVEHPARPEVNVAVIQIGARGGAVATSANNRRRWTMEGRDYHHLIDPRTGRPIARDLISATAFAATTARAEIETKQLIVAAGRGQPLDLVTADVGIVWVDGELMWVGGEGSDVTLTIVDARDGRHAA